MEVVDVIEKARVPVVESGSPCASHPTWPRSSKACAIDMPIMFTVRHINGCT